MMLLTKEQSELPAYFGIDSEKGWYLDLPSASFQGDNEELLFLLLCDLLIDTIEKLPEGKQIFSQISVI